MTRRRQRRYYLLLLKMAKRGYQREKRDLPDLSALELFPLADIPELEEIEIGGVKWKTHPASSCAGSNCCFHNPSDHPLKNARLISRPDRAYVSESGVFMLLMERVCPHGIGHADPDSVAWLNAIEGTNHWGVHGCCQEMCCLDDSARRRVRRMDGTFVFPQESGS